MGKYRKKPIVVEAVKYERFDDVYDFVGWENLTAPIEGRVGIVTLEGVVWAQKGDYIIRGVKGEFYPCKPDIFEATYEVVEAG